MCANFREKKRCVDSKWRLRTTAFGPAARSSPSSWGTVEELVCVSDLQRERSYKTLAVQHDDGTLSCYTAGPSLPLFVNMVDEIALRISRGPDLRKISHNQCQVHGATHQPLHCYKIGQQRKSQRLSIVSPAGRPKEVIYTRRIERAIEVSNEISFNENSRSHS